MRDGGKHRTDKKWAEKNLSQYCNFQEFVMDLQVPSQAQRVLNQVHFSPQYMWVLNSDGVIDVDVLLRFESLNKDVKELGRRLGQDLFLRQHKHKSVHPSYVEAYDDEMIKIVRGLYRRDIELFKYSYGLT